MTREDLGTRVRAIISELIGRRGREAAVSDASELVNDLDLDSLELIEVTVDVEDEFDLELSDEEVSHLRTVGDLIGHLAMRLGLVEVAA